MNTALLAISSLSLVTSVTTLALLGITVKKLQEAEKQLKSDVEDFKGKTNRNVRRIKSTLVELEL